MKTMIEGYGILPGEHCGSTAMRGLLKHYCGLELPEPAVFGLSAGLECATLESPAMDPGVAADLPRARARRALAGRDPAGLLRERVELGAMKRSASAGD